MQNFLRPAVRKLDNFTHSTSKNVQKAIKLQMWPIHKKKVQFETSKFNLNQINQRVVLESLKKIDIRWVEICIRLY